VPRAAALHRQHADLLVARAVEHRTLEVAVRVRRVHAQLADVVAPLLQEVHALQLHPQPVLRARVGHEAMHHRARHADVVALREAELAARRVQDAAAFVHVDQLVGVGVGDVHRIGRGRMHDADREVRVAEQRDARVDLRAARSSQRLRPVMTLGKRACVDVLGRAPAVRHLGGLVRVGTPRVIEDRVRPVEAVAGEALLEAQLAAVPQGDVVLRGDLADDDAIQH
jgi:hypothetical protein